MKLTVEYTKSKKGESEVTIFCDAEGLSELFTQLEILKKHKGHVHLMTPSWSGNELTEIKQQQDSELINHVRIILKDDLPHATGI